jgi:calcium channel MID1
MPWSQQMFLPPTLLLLVSSVLAQQATQLPLNQVFDSNVNASSNPSVFAIPSAQGALNLSVSLCTDQIPFPRFILTNDTSGGIPKLGDAGNSIFNITLDDGLGIWSGLATKGGFLAVYPGETLAGSVYPPWTFQIALSDSSMSRSFISHLLLISLSGPIHETLDALPLLGDTTSTQSLLFSEAFAPYTPSEPTYPNYTLPAVNSSYPDLPKSIPNFTLALLPTSSTSLLSKSACAIQVLNSSQNVIQSQPGVSTITRGPEGFRTQWIVEGLRASTNYTAFVVQDGTKISRPIFFQTKSCESISSS